MIDVKKTCYLFLDFDGTVFIKGGIPEENRRALKAAQRLGHKLILNTGRSRGGLDFSLEQHQGIDWDGVVFGGTDMTFEGVRYYEHLVSPEVVRMWVKYAYDHQYWLVLEGENSICRFRFEDLDWKEVSRKTEEFLKNDQATKMSIQQVDEQDDTMLGCLNLVRMPTYAEFFPDGRDKGVGFLDFCKFYRIPKEQCVCFGDSLNDLAIFEICPTSICMSHSPAMLKAHSTYCAKGAFGVAEGVEWLVGKNIY